jgi:hypothetical protein
MKTAYRHPPNHVEPGATVDPAAMIPVTDLNVKSVIASPTRSPVKPGAVRISGTAWSNGSPITRVDVSVDGGSTWKQANLFKDKSQYGWRLWELYWKAEYGKHTLMSRATNAAGQTQPLVEEWNPNGYLWNVAQRVEIFVYAGGMGEAAPAPPPPPPPPGYDSACLTCHDESMMVQQHLTPAQWDREVNKMTGWGAKMTPGQREAILKYLSDSFKQ